MAIYMSYSPNISQISGYSLVGDVRAGGDASPEYDIGNGSTFSNGEAVWDSYLGDGFDSTLRNVTLHLFAGGATLAVSGTRSGTLSYTGSGDSTIDRVEILLGVQSADMKVQWNNLKANFYSGGALLDSESLPGGYPIEADTLNGTGTSREALCTIVPPTTYTYDEAIITGNVEMICTDPWVRPAPNDIFAQIFAF
jgi:hypothetical protein